MEGREEGVHVHAGVHSECLHLSIRCILEVLQPQISNKYRETYEKVHPHIIIGHGILAEDAVQVGIRPFEERQILLGRDAQRDRDDDDRSRIHNVGLANHVYRSDHRRVRSS